MNPTLSYPQNPTRANSFRETSEYNGLAVADVSLKWNPNVPFHCTQEEFEERIRSIEQGNFTSLEEGLKKHKAWKKEYLANRLK
jgi:hypothetical protein